MRVHASDATTPRTPGRSSRRSGAAAASPLVGPASPLTSHVQALPSPMENPFAGAPADEPFIRREGKLPMGTLARRRAEAAARMGAATGRPYPGVPRRDISAASMMALDDGSTGDPRLGRLPRAVGPFMDDARAPATTRQRDTARRAMQPRAAPPSMLRTVGTVADSMRDPAARFAPAAGVEAIMLPSLLELPHHLPAGHTYEEMLAIDGEIRDAIGAVYVEMTQQLAEYVRVVQKTGVFAGLWWAGGGTEVIRELASQLIVEGSLGEAGTTVLADAFSYGLIDIAANPSVAVLGILYNGLGGYGYSLMNTFAVIWCTNRALEAIAAGGDPHGLAAQTVDFARALATHIRANPRGGANNNPLGYDGVVADLAEAPRLTDQLGIIAGWAATGFREVAANAATAMAMLDQAPQAFTGYIQERAGEAADAAGRVIPEAIQIAARDAQTEAARVNAMEVMRYEQYGAPGFRALRREPGAPAPTMGRVALNIGETILAGVVDSVNSARYVWRGSAADGRVSSLERANLRMAQWFADMYLSYHSDYLTDAAQGAWIARFDHQVGESELALHAALDDVRATTPDPAAGPAAPFAGQPPLMRRQSTHEERAEAAKFMRRQSNPGQRPPPGSGAVALAGTEAAGMPDVAPGEAAVVRRLSGESYASAVSGSTRDGPPTPTFSEWEAGRAHDEALEAMAAQLAEEDAAGAAPGAPPAEGGRRTRRQTKRKRSGGSRKGKRYARGGRTSRRLGGKSGGRRTRRARGHGGKRRRR